MRYVLWLASAAAATLLSGCAVYPAAPVAAQPGIVYGTPAPVGVAPAPYPYGYPYPYDYAYGYGGPAYYYGPPVFFSGSLAFVHRGGFAHRGFRSGGHVGGARPSGDGGLHVIPRGLRR